MTKKAKVAPGLLSAFFSLFFSFSVKTDSGPPEIRAKKHTFENFIFFFSSGDGARCGKSFSYRQNRGGNLAGIAWYAYIGS